MKPRGRTPTPTKLHIIRGNPGRRPLNEDEPQADPIPNAQPPDHLSKVAKAKWPQMVDLLSRCGLFTELDADLLAIYCEAHADNVHAKEQLAAEGRMLESKKNGYQYPNPYIAIKNQSWKTMQEIAAQFGMGPAARTRVGASHAPRSNHPKTPPSGLCD